MTDTLPAGCLCYVLRLNVSEFKFTKPPVLLIRVLRNIRLIRLGSGPLQRFVLAESPETDGWPAREAETNLSKIADSSNSGSECQ